MPLWLWFSLLLLITATAVGLVGLDTALATQSVRSRDLDPVLDVLEFVTLKDASEFIFPGVLLLVGGALWAAGRRRLGQSFCYAALVPLIAYIASDLSKPLFGRLRPYEMMERGLADTWFVGGNSFPSGHVAYFTGLAVPVVVLYPRAFPLLAIPVVVAVQRVLATDHYISDVAASSAMAVAAAILLLPIVRTGYKPSKLARD